MRIIFFMVLTLCSVCVSQAQDTTAYTQQEVIYGRKDGLALTMVVVKPDKSNARGIVSIISGNWISSHRRVEPRIDMIRPYLDKGYTMFLVMHGSQPRYAIPDAAADIKRAVQFVRYHAKQYNINPDQIGAVGHSSGGHLALMAGLADNEGNPKSSDPIEKISGKVQAVACFFPPTDFMNYGLSGVSPSNQKAFLQMTGLLGAFSFTRYDSSKRLYVEVTDTARINSIVKSISPAQLVTSDDPPVMIWHGDKDMLVPLQQSQVLQQKIEALKIPFVLKVKPGGSHGWKDMGEDEKDFIPWFDKHLKVK